MARLLPALLLLAAVASGLDEEISSSLELPAGIHRLSRPLRILADGITVDLGEAELVGADDGVAPDRFAGIGLLLEGRKNVTIRGGRLRGFRCAVLLEECEGVVLEGLDVSGNFRQRLKSTPEREDASDWPWPHANDGQEWRKNYGAGICLENCRDCTVTGCTGRRQQNGILLDRCTGCTIRDNDLSFNSGWGIALWRSSRNLVTGNRCDWCVRGYSHGVYDRGQDSAGILVFEQCSHNRFEANSATHSGDGFFLYAGHETTQKTGAGGCNGNVVYANDFSHAVANGIEATFSEGNEFAGNRLEDCNYGIWAGYSVGTRISGNLIGGSTHAGIAIEHGSDATIVGNRFETNPIAIDLWWDEDTELLDGVYGKARHCRSESYSIAGNAFLGDRLALRLRKTSRVRAERNAFDGVAAILSTEGPLDGIDVEQESASPAPLGAVLPEELPRLDPGLPRGREQILVDEWGPLDPRATAVFPRDVTAWESCTFHVLGAPEGYVVTGLPAGLVAETGPKTFRVQGGRDGLNPFTAVVRAAGREFPVSGLLLKARWTVQFWKWEKDPREHPLPEGEPLASLTLPKLEFAWGGGAPAKGVPADRFATRARARMRLPKGRYELRTMSDDGVRVRVDGDVVLENWTWHGPTENRVVVELEGGEHAFGIEHFELDGWAVLAFDLRPVR